MALHARQRKPDFVLGLGHRIQNLWTPLYIRGIEDRSMEDRPGFRQIISEAVTKISARDPKGPEIRVGTEDREEGNRTRRHLGGEINGGNPGKAFRIKARFPARVGGRP